MFDLIWEYVTCILNSMNSNIPDTYEKVDKVISKLYGVLIKFLSIC